jgi:SagB-type dehydrogenase family enzyme
MQVAEVFRGYAQRPTSPKPHLWKRYRAAVRYPFDEADSLGRMLAAIYGLTRQRWQAEAHAAGLKADLLRPVPSGGGRYPCEVYLLIGAEQYLPAGVYYYDGAHHALVQLRSGAQMAALQACVAQTNQAPALALLLSCRFWKTAWRYGEFSYRLHSLDIGVVIGQSLAVAATHDYHAQTYYHFCDAAANALIGCDGRRESVYAIVALHTQDMPASRADDPPSTPEIPAVLADDASDAPLTVACEPDEQPDPLAQWPQLAALHAAAIRRTSTTPQSVPSVAAPPAQSSLALPPAASLDIAAGGARRRSARPGFVSGSITTEQLALLLAAATVGYRNDLDGRPSIVRHTLLYCAINQVDAVQPGVYRYCSQQHRLELISAGEIRFALQQTLRHPSHNMSALSLSIFPVTCYEVGFDAYGDRWYRVQNMEAGLLLQRLALAAATLGLGSYISLAYHMDRAAQLLQLPATYTTLAQIMIGHAACSGPSYEQPSAVALRKERYDERA